MNVHASIGIPARCEISAMGMMSLRCVRAAQLGRILSFLSGDLAGQPFDSGGVCSACAGQTDVGCVDAECFHQVKQFEFLFDRGFGDGRRLQTVAQSFVVDTDVAVGRGERRLNRIPIVN